MVTKHFSGAFSWAVGIIMIIMRDDPCAGFAKDIAYGTSLTQFGRAKCQFLAKENARTAQNTSIYPQIPK
jgi:hypothetical protein